MSDDNLSKQSDELEALISIYGDKVTVRTNNEQKTCGIEIDDVTLNVTMLHSYPNESPPIYEISAPFLRGVEKRKVCQKLEDIYAESFIGEPGVIYAWTECIREFVNEWKSRNSESTVDIDETSYDDCDEVSKDIQDKLKLSTSAKCPDILTGGCIEDRKSVFQPHFARVNSMDEVKLVTNYGLFIYDVTQVKVRGLHFCDSMYEGLSKTGNLVCRVGRGPGRRLLIKNGTLISIYWIVTEIRVVYCIVYHILLFSAI